MFDNLCVHGKYLVSSNPNFKRSGEDDFDYISLDLKEKALPYFFDSMLSTMDIRLKPVPIFAKYLGEFDMEVKKWKLS